jgi:TolA-binding protein
MIAEKGINILVNVIEKVASMVNQVKDLQQKIDEANNNICRLKNRFMEKTKQTENSNKNTTKKKLKRITPKKSKKRKIGNEIGRHCTATPFQRKGQTFTGWPNFKAL